MLCMYGYFISFCCQTIVHCLYKPNFVSHSSVDVHVGCLCFSAIVNGILRVFVHKLLWDFWLNNLEWACWRAPQLHAAPFEELPACFSKWLHGLTFPPAVREGPSFSASLPTRVWSAFPF